MLTTGHFYAHTEGSSFLSTEAGGPLPPGRWERFVLPVRTKVSRFLPIILTAQFAIDCANRTDPQEPLEGEEDDRHEHEPEERKPETVCFREQKRTHSSGQELEQQGVEWKEGHHGHEEILLEPQSLHDIHGPEE